MQRTKLKIAIFALALTVVAVSVCAIPVIFAASDQGLNATVNPRVQSVERLVIRYSASGFELLSRTPLQKVLPPSAKLPATKGLVSGSWFEVQSNAGDVVYRRRISSPRILYTEVPTDDDPGVLKRDEAVVEENVFSVLVPAGKDANALIFFDSGTDIQKRTEASSEIGRIGLR